MSELSPNLANDFEKLRFAKQNEQIKSLCNKILEDRPESGRKECMIYLKADPESAEKRLRSSSFSKIVLAENESLSQQPPEALYPDLDMFVGNAQPVAVGIRAWRLVPGDREPSEENNTYRLSIEVCYEKNTTEVWESIRLELNPRRQGTPGLYRRLLAAKYLNNDPTDYKGHSHQSLNGVQPKNIKEFLAIFSELYEKRDE
jgi:hypothetical protein